MPVSGNYLDADDSSLDATIGHWTVGIGSGTVTRKIEGEDGAPAPASASGLGAITGGGTMAQLQHYSLDDDLLVRLRYKSYSIAGSGPFGARLLEGHISSDLTGAGGGWCDGESLQSFITTAGWYEFIIFGTSGPSGSTLNVNFWAESNAAYFDDVEVVTEPLLPPLDLEATVVGPRLVKFTYARADQEINDGVPAWLAAIPIYSLERSTNGVDWVTVDNDNSLTTPAFYDWDPEPDTEYVYRARAFTNYLQGGPTWRTSSYGNNIHPSWIIYSAYSDEISVTTPPTAGDPPSETGWTVTTLHDAEDLVSSSDVLKVNASTYDTEEFTDNFSSKYGLDTTPDGQHLYIGRSLAVDSAGNMYGIRSSAPRTIAKVTPDGTRDDTWFEDFVTGLHYGYVVTMGRDGYLYAICRWNADECRVLKINTATATAVEIAQLAVSHIDNGDDYEYFDIAAGSDGTIWILLWNDNDENDPNWRANTVVRRWQPGDITYTDIPIQRIVNPDFSPGGESQRITVAFDDSVVILMYEYSIDTSWALRVKPDGTVRHIAGNWTQRGMIDGAVGVSRMAVADAQFGSDPSGRKLYFIDASYYNEILRMITFGVTISSLRQRQPDSDVRQQQRAAL